MQKTKAIIYSGGMDSTTLLYDKQDEIGLAITFNYGSKHNEIEYSHASWHTNKLGIKHLWINLSSAMEHFESDLLKTGGEIPEGHYEDDNMAKTVVPFRNGIMLSIAAGLAESKGLDSVLIANHFGDDAQYPDCRQSFIDPMTQAINAGTSNGVKLEAPYTHLTKEQIARIGYKAGIDWNMTWSCYKGGGVQCGKCGTCVERIWALRNYQDTTVYSDKEYAINLLKEKGEWDKTESKKLSYDLAKEDSYPDHEKALEAVKTILDYIGEDSSREGLQETPARFLKAWKNHWGAGYRQEPKAIMKVFTDGAQDYDEMVLVKNIAIYSHCEHHIAPIIGVAHIAYIPNGKIIGLSKLARLAEVFARRLQVQERLTTQIAQALMEELEPLGVAVVIEAEHLCMSSRGVEKQGSLTTTSKLLGCFADESATRSEFMQLIRN